MKASTDDRLDLDQHAYRKSSSQVFRGIFDYSFILKSALNNILEGAGNFNKIVQTHNVDESISVRLYNDLVLVLTITITPSVDGMLVETSLLVPGGDILVTE